MYSDFAIGERLFQALKFINITNTTIAEEFGITPQYVSNLKKSDKLNDLISKIALKHAINLNWILTGHGDMFTNNFSIVNSGNLGVEFSGAHAVGVDKSTGKNFGSSSTNELQNDFDLLYNVAKGFNQIDYLKECMQKCKKEIALKGAELL